MLSHNVTAFCRLSAFKDKHPVSEKKNLPHRFANPSSLLEAALLLFGKGGEVSDRGGCVTIGFRFDRDDKEDVLLQLH